MAPSAEAQGIEVLWHLPDSWHILFHTTAEGVVWKGHVHLPRSALSFANRTVCFSAEVFKLC